MTWSQLLRSELRRLHAQEGQAALTFEEMEAQASGALARTVLREAIDAAPARQTRLELVLEPREETDRDGPLRSFDGWREDVRDLGRGASMGEAHDAALLGLLLRMMRSRTSCYEVAHILASSLGSRVAANFLSALWRADLDLDARAAQALARIVDEGEGRWDLSALTR